MVRRVRRPYPVSRVLAAIGVSAQGRVLRGVEKRGPVLFYRQHEVAASLVDELGGGLDGVQGVRGDRHLP